MPIVESFLRSNTLQADGSRNVTERHTDHAGRTYDVTYLCPVGVDPALVLTARAAKIGTEVDARDAAEAVANNFELPLTKFQFRQRFGAEQEAVDEFNATFESNGLLTAAQKRTIRTGLKNFEASGGVYLGNPTTISSVQAYESLGVIAAGRAVEILTP